MFTGIIEEIGKVRSINSASLSVECKSVLNGIKLGDSIAVDGICLTIIDFTRDWFIADVMPETFRSTELDYLTQGSKVNLERALKVSDRLGGHIVSGHIDGSGIITEKRNEGNAVWFTVRAPKNVLKYMVPKGSVALNGTSLTIEYMDEKIFKVSLIPLTQGITNLNSKKAGDEINIECDIIGKYVQKLVCGTEQISESSIVLTEDFLNENGFV